MMKRALLLGTGLLLISAIVCALIISYAFLSSWPRIFFPEDVDKDEIAYSAEKTMDGFRFEVTLFRNHPMLAEYRKLLRVKRGDKLILERAFIDTGGLASFYFLRKGKNILILDGIRNGFVLDTKTAAIANVDLDSVPAEFPDVSFGRFMFVRESTRTYKWVAREDLPAAAK